MPRKKSKAASSDAAKKPSSCNESSSYRPTREEGGGDADDLDLTLQRQQRRLDEETVLSAIYGEDFIAEAGAWNCPVYKLRIHPEASNGAPPPTITTATTTSINHHCSCELTLTIQLNKKYPHSIPLIYLANTGNETTNFQITTTQISELLNLLQIKAAECLGEVMCWELGQVVEAYLVGCIESRRNKLITMHEKNELFGMEKKKKNNNNNDKNNRIKNSTLNAEDRGCEADRDDDDDDDDWLNFGEHEASTSDVGNDANDFEARGTEFDTMVDSDTQREIDRQIEAMDTAARMRKQRRQRRVLPSIADINNDGDIVDEGNSDEEGFNYPELTSAITFTAEQQQLGGGGGNLSRYQTDFVEIAHLGRGGGGEVVQAINRLDRRVYAIKKVPLEEEVDVTTTAWTTMQNEKLRREVTTISMMSHKNIVRYYQAWVEYPMVVEKEKEGMNSDIDRAHNDSGGATTMIDENMLKGNKDDKSESSSWESGLSSSVSSSSSVDSSSTASSSSDSCSSLSKLAVMTTDKSLSQLSLDNFLEHEVGITDFTNPLLGHCALFGYPPVLTSPSSKPTSTSQDHQLQSQSFSTSNRMFAKNSGIMYIQMQYCKTTMRDMIDESKLSIETVWKSLRQILEALVYIHGRNVIHRDLKPANIFIDEEENIRLGDFGLATSNRPSAKPNGSGPESEANALYEAIDDSSGLLDATSFSSANRTHNSISMVSITGGVGTALYMAPEQEFSKSLKGKPSYDSKADIFSLGILLFEMFMLKPIGCTYMERVEILTALRGEPRRVRGTHSKEMGSLFSESGEIVGDLKHHIDLRFPAQSNIPFNAQKLILWCLERSPECRPSAEQLLTCDLLPRKVELEEKYLNEVMRTLSKSEQSYQQILATLFRRSNPSAVLTTFDNEISIRANNIIDAQQLLTKALGSVKGPSVAARGLLSSRPMSGVALAGAISALRRAHHAGTVSGGGKEGEALRGVPHHVAMIIAMTAASSAAVEGCAYGALGADTRVVECLCRKLCDIFYSHGAIRLQGPLLRPTDPNDVDTSLNRPVDFLARRGSVLRLREDLCIPFARALSRGGSSTTNLKRFDINKVFSESDAGLHPKESLEASFDIIQDENTAISEFLEAETILVVCQAMSLLATKLNDSSSALLKSPNWVLKLTHTRLSDAIMDMMFLPTSEAIRQSCLNIFTAIMSCPPGELYNQIRKPAKEKTCETKHRKLEFLDKCIETAVIVEKLPKNSGKRLRAFLYHLLIPQHDANKVLDTISESIREMHNADMNSSNNSTDVKNLSINCYSEAVRCINQLRHLIKAMEALGIVATSKIENLLDGTQKNVSYPTFISIDLGLRHRRNHFSGRLYFQAVLLHSDFFRGNGENDMYATIDGKGTRIAEGGRYDDLVRQFRPPGKFGSVNEYTVAKAPFCSGLLIFVGKMVEHIYHYAAYDEKRQNQSFIENLRSSLGHPLPLPPINCIVMSENGLDLDSCAQRAKICALLWGSGISCEYLAHSGVMMSLLQHMSSNPSINNEWSSSVDRICGICAILNIPFVIIVQPHLLKTKSVVKLRGTITYTASGLSYNVGEELVPLSSLPTVLVERLGSQSSRRDDTHFADLSSHLISNDDNLLVVQSQNKTEIECIYVGIDQYFDSEHKANNTQWRHVKKVMKATTQKLATRMNDLFGQSLPVIAMDLPFQAVRDIGSSLIFDGLASLTCSMLQSKYQEHKKVLRNLAYALDALLKKSHSRRTSSEEKNQLTLFLYSIPCDKFDMIDLALP